MQRLALAHHTMFADLVQRCLDAAFDEQFPEGGNFVRHTRGARAYWYYVPSSRGDKTGRKPIYVGPDDDPALVDRVTRFSDIKADFRERRTMVVSLRAAGLPTPDTLTGDVTEALWKAGLFRLRGVLVGTTAFQTYVGLLGTKFPGAVLTTGDADFAQFHSVSILVNDTMPPMLEVLGKVDASFKPVPHLGSPAISTAYSNRLGYRVEFLVPNRGSDDNQGKPTVMPALGGSGAEPLRYLDFLIFRPVHSVLLHKGGIPVTVPAPERYAVHKLIVAALRKDDADGYAKARKDTGQAALLLQALTEDRRAMDAGFAWMEAWRRGPRWADRLRAGRRRLDPADATLLHAAVLEACEADRSHPGDYGYGGAGA